MLLFSPVPPSPSPVPCSLPTREDKVIEIVSCPRTKQVCCSCIKGGLCSLLIFHPLAREYWHLGPSIFPSRRQATAGVILALLKGLLSTVLGRLFLSLAPTGGGGDGPGGKEASRMQSNCSAYEMDRHLDLKEVSQEITYQP